MLLILFSEICHDEKIPLWDFIWNYIQLAYLGFVTILAIRNSLGCFSVSFSQGYSLPRRTSKRT